MQMEGVAGNSRTWVFLSEHITRLPDCHYAPGIREANIPDTFKNE